MGSRLRVLASVVIAAFLIITCATSYVKAEPQISSIPVILYHSFSEKESDGSISADLFEQHLKAVKENGYTSITPDDLYSGRLPAKPIMITADDGYMDNYKIMYPLLKKYKMEAAIFVTTSSVGRTPGSVEHFGWKQAKEMESSGFVEIGCHGLVHINHAKLRATELKALIKISMEDLESNLGKRKVKVFAYPNMAYSVDTIKVLKESGIQMQFTGFGKTSGTVLSDLKRYTVGNKLSADELIRNIQ